MYKVTGHPFGRTFRVVWAMEEMGLEYTHIWSGYRSKEMLELNPTGKSPVLEFDGNCLFDSCAILQFLADRHGQMTYPVGTLDRAQQDSFLYFVNDEIDGRVGGLALHSYGLPPEHRVPQIRPTNEWEFAKSMRALNSRLGSNTYLMGEKFTVPDIVLVHCLVWGKKLGLKLVQPGVIAYLKRVRARPAYKRVQSDRLSRAAEADYRPYWEQ